MSAALGHWVRGLVALALFGLLAELLLPSRATAGYVRLVIGIVLLAAVVSPVLGLVRGVLGGGMDGLAGAGAPSLGAALMAEGLSPQVQAREVAGAFATEAAAAVRRAVGAVPGVREAAATVDVAAPPAGYGEVMGVHVTVWPTPWAAAHGQALAARVRAAAASALGLGEGKIWVRVRAPPAGG
ncbi:MAG: stage III sporulation protein AF [Firmicutes bacterium]|nr:stage III sporulation protein AF [Bacillota bacterium]